MEVSIGKRLRKVGVLIDRHLDRIAIQAYYIKTLLASPEEEDEYKVALGEAIRLEAYHTKELQRLREEQNNLSLAAKPE